MQKQHIYLKSVGRIIIVAIVSLLFSPASILADSFSQRLDKELQSNKTTYALFSTAVSEEGRKQYDSAALKFEQVALNNPNTLLGMWAYAGKLACYKQLENKEKFNKAARAVIDYTKKLLNKIDYKNIYPVITSILAEFYAALDNPTKQEITEGKEYALQSLQGLEANSPDGYRIWKSKMALGNLYEHEQSWSQAEQTYKDIVLTVKDKFLINIAKLNLAKVLIKVDKKKEAKIILDELNAGIKKDSKMGKEIQEILDQLK
jgi:hypothetical protein